MRSGESIRPDGSVEKWNPQVGRWETIAKTTPAVAVQATPDKPARAITAMPSGRTSRRMYAAARNTRATVGFGSSGNSSADAEISLSLTQLRARARQMVRDSNYAKRIRSVLVNNIVGAGIPIQGQVLNTRGELHKAVNDGIEQAWSEWAKAPNCHTGGTLHFYDLERMALAQVVEAGEVFIRLHRSRFGTSVVPLALEMIEPERVGHDIVEPGAASSDTEVRMGVEVDRFHRPVAYWIRERHPGDIRGRVGSSERYERVPAEDILHLCVRDRWPQTRGVPWMHAALLKLDQVNEYATSEVQAARFSAAYFATIETPEEQDGLPNTEEDDGQQVMDIEPGVVQQLAPGEKLEFHAPNRPNTAIDPFLRYMLRDIASGSGVSYESLSRDYSQSNFAGARQGLIEDRDDYRTLQQWWVRTFRAPLHSIWMQAAVLSRAINAIPVGAWAIDMPRYESVRFKLRGWGWVDPRNDVLALKEARKAGFISTTQIIAQTAGGMDVEDVIADIQRENALYEAADIDRDTDVVEPAEQTAQPTVAKDPTDPEDTTDTTDRARPRVVALR